MPIPPELKHEYREGRLWIMDGKTKIAEVERGTNDPWIRFLAQTHIDTVEAVVDYIREQTTL
jgi:hypothetical protein